MLSALLVRLGLHPHLVAAAVLASDSSINVNGGLIASVVQFGFLGAVFIDVVGTHKFLVPRWTVDALEASYKEQLALKDGIIEGKERDLEELKTANGKLQELTQERLIPALVSATEISKAYVTELARRNEKGGS